MSTKPGSLGFDWDDLAIELEVVLDMVGTPTGTQDLRVRRLLSEALQIARQEAISTEEDQ